MSRVRLIIPHNKEDIRRELIKIGPDKGGIDIMIPKGQFFLIKLYEVPLKGAVLIKQEMLAKGGEAAVPRGVGGLTLEKSDLLLMGTLKQYRQVMRKLRQQPFGLKELAGEMESVLKKALDNKERSLDLRGHKLPLGERTLIMGVLNVTPDSFSDGGLFYDLDKAVDYAIEMVQEGIDVLDIGGESTRPGSAANRMDIPDKGGESPPPQLMFLSAEEELKRVVPILDRVLKEVDVPVSIDTYKAAVAQKALEMGAHMINDIWGLKADSQIASVVADYQVPVCIMHNRKVAEYQDLITDIIEDLKESIEIALKAGIKEENIVLDPGIGFAKNPEENLEVMHHLEEFAALGYPVLLGTSRKSMIGKVLDLPVDDRVEGTAATLAYGITKGVDIVRVHDIKYMQKVVKMTDAMVRRP